MTNSEMEAAIFEVERTRKTISNVKAHVEATMPKIMTTPNQTDMFADAVMNLTEVVRRIEHHLRTVPE